MSKTCFPLLSLLLMVLCVGCGALTHAQNVQVANPKQAVSDARRLMAEKRTSLENSEKPKFYAARDLPESLRIEKLMFAYVSNDHISLILAKNPDWLIGARIWSLDSTRKHADQPTKYPEIYFFDYTNDAPESPDNIQ